MTQDEAARQLFNAVQELFRELYWPGDNTGYVHTDTIDPLADAMVALARAWEWPVGLDVAAYVNGRRAARERER
jgi:hypothetical protein